MDSHIVVDVGNIYANEALFAAKINPRRTAGKLTLADCKILVKNIIIILNVAIKQGGTTLRDFLSSDGKPGCFSEYLQEYSRRDPRWKVKLKTFQRGQRATVFVHRQKINFSSLFCPEKMNHPEIWLICSILLDFSTNI